jgi:hypothetical protein
MLARQEASSRDKAKNHQRTSWTSGRLHDVEGDVVLRCINECGLLLSIYNIIVWWWIMLTQTIISVTIRIKYKQCHQLDKRPLLEIQPRPTVLKSSYIRFNRREIQSPSVNRWGYSVVHSWLGIPPHSPMEPSAI